MKSPTEPGKVFSETTKRTTKEVRMILTDAQLEEAISDYLTRNFPQFRNMDLDFDWRNAGDLEVIAVRETEEKTP